MCEIQSNERGHRFALVFTPTPASPKVWPGTMANRIAIISSYSGYIHPKGATYSGGAGQWPFPTHLPFISDSARDLLKKYNILEFTLSLPLWGLKLASGQDERDKVAIRREGKSDKLHTKKRWSMEF